MKMMRLAENDSASSGSAQGVGNGAVAVGSFWTYDLKDEISGEIIQTRVVIVTDTSNGQIATRLNDAKTGRS
jgi:hypothetical protein